MPAREDDVAALAKALGVASFYLDQSDDRVEIAQDTQRALMKELGFPAENAGERKDSLERATALRQRALPLWRVIDADAPAQIEWPRGSADKALGWRLSGEGVTREGRAGARLELPALAAGYYHLDVETSGGTQRSFLIVAPRTCWLAPPFDRDEARGWGLTAQVYGLRSHRNLGFGDLTDVADLAKSAARSGASFVGLSPLHALFPSDRSKISPYSPSSRLFIEPLYLDPEVIGQAAEAEALRPRIERLRASPLVDYREAWDVKRRLLEALFRTFEASGGGADYTRKRAAFGEALEWHATFEALSEHFSAEGLAWPGVWPSDYFEKDSAAVARFRRDHEKRIAFHAWLQVMADDQLARAAKANGLEIGLYRDLAVGADRFGSEVWASPHRYALSLSVGAPPDPLGPQGQNWGFPPFNPITLETDDFAAFRDLVAANMRHAGAIRIDHAFQLERLFLVPPGQTAAHGGYVAFPFEALLGILRVESQRHRCMVIAEDLGTGPQGFSDAIMQSGLLSYRILSFERTKTGGFVAPEDYPRPALAAITTHDLPTFKGWLRGFDIDLRSHFGVYSEAEAQREQQGRRQDVEHWREALHAQNLSGDVESDSVARNEALAYLARTRSALMAVQIEDILDELNQANLPGLSEGPPNWRRRMSESIERFAAEGGPLDKCGALMAQEGRTPRARETRLAGAPPRATYRLQFHAGFTFDMARAILPYLRKLGISHVYASPIQKARKGSTHGYDVVDPREINPELGGREAFDLFAKELHEQGLKLIIDIVPNHMGVGAENPFWASVLQWGERSPYARVFDIDFVRGQGRVMLPVLGRPYGEALDAGEFSLAFDRSRGFVIRYFDRAFPVAPSCYDGILTEARQAIATAAQAAKVEALSERFDEPYGFVAALTELARLAGASPVMAAIEQACATITSDRRRLDALLRRQAYRLAYWRLAGSEINYRRFFEINALAGVRVEDPEVMHLTHALIYELVDRGQVDGLRIDHIDGLADPAGYLTRLQQRVGPGFYIVAEKILERGEQLKNWPLAGTTGYDALNEIDGVLVDQEARGAIEAFYRDVVGEAETYPDALARAKSFILEHSFGAECEKLVDGFYALAQSARATQDIGRPSLRRALTALIVALPVYRTYAAKGGADAQDRAHLARARELADTRLSPSDAQVCDFLVGVLSGDRGGAEAASLRTGVEQLTGPVMAKGLEDTLFYRYAPFLALNEVGADPSHFGFSDTEFHESAAARARDWPASMIASSTHDTKRGEDARARLFALSAEPDRFCTEAKRFLDLAQGADRNDAYILLQSLVAAWPLDEEESRSEDFRDRARAYFEKALREAKRRSSWSDPDEAYEQAALGFLDSVLQRGEAREIIARLVERTAWPGALNSLARLLLKLTAPGVPDFYQGAGFWDFSFVDPDNRRPVDFDTRLRRLEEEGKLRPQMLLADWRDGRIKQWLVSRLLAHRAAHPEFYAYADYQRRDCAAGLAFERRRGAEALFVCTPTGTRMLKSGLIEKSGSVRADALWRSEKLQLEPGGWRNLLTGSAFAVEGAATCAEIADGLPWLILGKFA